LQSVLNISFHYTIYFNYHNNYRLLLYGRNESGGLNAIQMVILLEFAYLYLFWMGFIKANPNFTGFDSERLQVIDIPNLDLTEVLMDFYLWF
jgi:hypothetical protein